MSKRIDLNQTAKITSESAKALLAKYSRDTVRQTPGVYTSSGLDRLLIDLNIQPHAHPKHARQAPQPRAQLYLHAPSHRSK